MSNRYYSNINKVENVKTGDIYYEIDIFDDYGYGSVDVTEEQTTMNDMETLQYLKDIGSDMSSGVCGVIDGLFEQQKGITINKTFYDWDEIKQVFEETPDS